MSEEITLFCWVQGDELDRIFPVDIKLSASVGHLKKAIQEQKKSFRDITPDSLNLWKVAELHCFTSVPSSDSPLVRNTLGKYQQRCSSVYQARSRRAVDAAVEVHRKYMGDRVYGKCSKRCLTASRW